MSKEFLDIDIFTQLPQSLNNDKGIVNLFKAIDKELKEIVNKRNYLYLIANVDILPERIIELLAWQWHVDFWDTDLSLDRKRVLVKSSIRWHCIKGTPAAVEEVVRAAYGNCDLQEWFKYGVNPYYFKIRVKLEEESTDKSRWKNVLAAIESTKNVRSYMEEILFYYPPIHLPIKIHHTARCMQYIKADHCVWNLGTARSTYWDDEFCFDDTIRFDEIYPNELYRERQLHAVKTTGLANVYMPIKIIHIPKAMTLANVQQNIKITHHSMATQQIQSAQDIQVKHTVKVTPTVNIEQSTSCRYTNMFDDSFCFDDSHYFDDVQENTEMIRHACTVRTLKKDGSEGERETI